MARQPFPLGEKLLCVRTVRGGHIAVGSTYVVLAAFTNPSTGHWVRVRADNGNPGNYHVSCFAGGPPMPAYVPQPEPLDRDAEPAREQQGITC